MNDSKDAFFCDFVEVMELSENDGKNKNNSHE